MTSSQRQQAPPHPLRRDADDPAILLPRIERRSYFGAQGMRELPLEARIDCPDPGLFEAEIVVVDLGSTQLRRVSMSPHRGVVDARSDGARTDVLRFLTLQSGAIMRVAPNGHPVRFGVGEALFTFRPRTYAYVATEPVVVVSSILPLTTLPSIVRRLEDLPVGALPHLPLVDAVVDLLVHLADRLDEPWSFDADFAARGLIDLETAILTEMVGPQVPVPGPERVRQAAIEYVDRHLGDPDLGPPQIAEALGVSLRYLHRAFDDTEMTVARHLRERRLEQVAAVLRAAERPPQLDGIAARFGFGSQDGLARAFRRRYGMSMTEYRLTRPRQADAP